MPPEPPENPPASPTSTDLSALARETGQETLEALPPPGASGPPAGGDAAGQGSASGAPAGPTDAWGRAFDPTLHLTKAGSPSVHPRTGRLMCLPGKGLRGQPGAPRPRATASGHASAGSTLDALGEGAPGAAAGTGQAAPGAGEQQQLVTTPIMTVEEIQRRAELDANAYRKLVRLVGRWMAGKDEGEFQRTPDDEAEDITTAMADYLAAENIRLPIGNLGLVLITTGSYIARVWGSDRHQERMEWLAAKLQGREPEKKDDGGQQQRPQPAAAPGQQLRAEPAEPGKKDAKMETYNF